MATGVLPVFVGSATRAVSYAEAGDKEYIAGLRLGLVTNTQDTSGEVVAQHPAVRHAGAAGGGSGAVYREIDQVPPMYSAIKIGGQKLYELARKGQEIERPARTVTIHGLELLEPEEPGGDWRLRVRCSKGTYVRALCHDIGRALGCGGCMEQPAATMAAGFTLAECRTIEDVQQQGESLLAATDSLFRQYPAYRIPSEQADRRCLLRESAGGGGLAAGAVPGLRHGRDVSVPEPVGKRVSDLEKNFFGA